MIEQSAPETQIRLGIGERVSARLPSADEQVALGVGPNDPVLVVRHTDREFDVVPARGAVVVARGFGVVIS